MQFRNVILALFILIGVIACTKKPAESATSNTEDTQITISSSNDAQATADSNSEATNDTATSDSTASDSFIDDRGKVSDNPETFTNWKAGKYADLFVDNETGCEWIVVHSRGETPETMIARPDSSGAQICRDTNKEPGYVKAYTPQPPVTKKH